MKVLIGTQNPGKIEGAKRAFSRYFQDVEVIGVKVESEIPEQPFDQELLMGARNRVKNTKKYALDNNIEADYYVAVEGGITTSLGTIIEMNLAVIEDNNGFQSAGTSQGFPIPERYMDDIRKTDLGTVMDKIFSEKELAKGIDGIGLLTKQEVSRIDITENRKVYFFHSATSFGCR